jgi:hypothetical protein
MLGLGRKVEGVAEVDCVRVLELGSSRRNYFHSVLMALGLKEMGVRGAEVRGGIVVHSCGDQGLKDVSLAQACECCHNGHHLLAPVQAIIESTWSTWSTWSSSQRSASPAWRHPLCGSTERSWGPVTLRGLCCHPQTRRRGCSLWERIPRLSMRCSPPSCKASRKGNAES